MSVSAFSPNLPSQTGYLHTPLTQPGTSFQELSQALQSGNLTSAQQIFSTLTQNTSAFSQIQNPQLQQDLSAIGTDLNSGNISNAQKAYSAFKTDLQNTVSNTQHHHHHAHGSTRETSGSSLDTPNLGANPLGNQSTISSFLSPLSVLV